MSTPKVNRQAISDDGNASAGRIVRWTLAAFAMPITGRSTFVSSPRYSALLAIGLGGLLLTAACRPTASESEPATEGSLASTSDPMTDPNVDPNVDPPVGTERDAGAEGESTSPSDITTANGVNRSVDEQGLLDMGEALFGSDESSGSAADSAASAQVGSPPVGDGDNAAPATVPRDRLNLPPNLTAPRLVDFLKTVDIEMWNVSSGRRQMFDHDEALAELTRLARLKLEAARRLSETSAPDTEQRSLSIRGQLQALSHLASLGDLASAELLEKFAWEHLDSSDGAVVLDSQLVLVGLAMERLQNGNATDSQEILGLIDRIARSDTRPDVSALMVMGQALSVLRQYGDDEAAERVRATILDLFASHSNPDVAEMAIQLAGSPKLAEVDRLMTEFGRTGEIDLPRWRSAVNELITDSPELSTVQYLAGAALQFESAGQLEATVATFDVLSGAELGARESREVATATAARQARRALIGESLTIDLPSVDGRPLSLDSYAGRVVVMPLWAVGLPDSLGVLQTLGQLRRDFAGQVEIVGMNLDHPEAPAAEFLARSPVAFRSFQSPTSRDGTANPIAERFGVVSLPFIVVIDAAGQVVAINLTGQRLAEQISAALDSIDPKQPTADE